MSSSGAEELESAGGGFEGGGFEGGGMEGGGLEGGGFEGGGKKGGECADEGLEGDEVEEFCW